MHHAASAPHPGRAPTHHLAPGSAALATAPALVPKRKARPRRNSIRLTAVTTAIAGALAFAALTHWGTNARQVRPVLDEADRLAELAGLGVRQVFLTGHRMTSDRDIFGALDLAHTRSLLRFDSLAVRERIEELPWIETVAITRIFPDSISIEVSERKPFAVWHTRNRDVLIDIRGRVLGAAPPSAQAGLPRFSGDGAASEAAAITRALEEFPNVKARLREAVRIAERRWTLRLTGGPEIHLPAGREADALRVLTSSPAGPHLIDGGRHAVIDLRSPDRIIVRPLPAGESNKTASGHNAQPSG